LQFIQNTKLKQNCRTLSEAICKTNLPDCMTEGSIYPETVIA